MNNIEELKSKKPENLKSRSSVLADYVTDDNTGGYFVVECGNCGEVFPSQKLDGGDAIADSGDYGDAYCPHCNETDPDECANVGLVWNVQQAKINALIAQLEAAQKERDEATQRLIRYSMSAGEADQRMCESRAVRDELGFEKDADDVAPIDLRNAIVAIRERAESAEAALSAANEKLSKPVVLPRMHVGFDGVSTNAGDSVRNKAISDCAEAIRVAGFTVDEGQDLWLT
ncbi:hypothetical protein [Yersinia kristensenii]|uniref:hypothetical protein n=1 Tax=Yersinia kristensenii TaxID=28152 RepID=UPI0016437AB7|nr:hypothetical protein [Yersinia kristensenii]